MTLIDLQQKWKWNWDYRNDSTQELVKDLHNAGYNLVVDLVLDPWFISHQCTGNIYSLDLFNGDYLRTILLHTPDLFL